MDLQTRNITLDEFKEYFGIDLRKELRGGDNPSNVAEAFLARESDRLEAFICARLNKNMQMVYRLMDDYSKGCYKKALLEQCYYVFRNGEIGSDSGYDFEKGEVAGNGTLSAKAVAPIAKNYLISCGIWNANVWGRPFWYGY